MHQRGIEYRHRDIALVKKHAHLGAAKDQAIRPPVHKPLRDRHENGSALLGHDVAGL